MNNRISRILQTVVATAVLGSASALSGAAIGYMNVFEIDGVGPGGFVFGSAWGVPDLKTTIVNDPGTMIGTQLILQPNFNTYAENPGDAFWRDNAGAGPGGNKWMEANTIWETPGLSFSSYTFEGNVTSNTLDGAYTAEAFIKVLDPGAGFATVLNDTVLLPATGEGFSITSDLSAFQGLLLQTGFVVNGINANPDFEAALGSVSVTVIPEPSVYAALLGFAALAWVIARRRRVA